MRRVHEPLSERLGVRALGFGGRVCCERAAGRDASLPRFELGRVLRAFLPTGQRLQLARRILRVQGGILPGVGGRLSRSGLQRTDRTVNVPMGETWGFALGAQYAVKPNLTLGASYALAWLGDMSVNQPGGPLTGRIVGDFTNSSFNIFALNLKWTY